MKTTVEKLSPTRVKLTISVTPEELKPRINHAYEHIAEQVNIPGFRKGKVPPPIIDQRVGKAAVLEHAVNEGLDGFYRQAVDENEVRPLGRPEADITEWPNEKDFSGDLLLTIEVDVRPEFDHPELRRPRPSRSTRPRSPTTTSRTELDNLRSRFGTLVTVDRPAKTGDFAQIDLVATIGDDEVDTANSISYEIGSGELIEGIDEALDSLTAGETTTFEAPLLGGDHEGENAQITVTLIAVKERELPEADDDFAQIASEFDTIDELRDSLREQVGALEDLRPGHRRPRPARREAPRARRDPGPASSSSRTRCTVTSRARTASRTTSTAPRSPSRARRPSARRSCSTRSRRTRTSRSARTSSPSTSSRAPRSTAWSRTSSSRSSSENGQIPSMVGEVARNKALAIVLGKAKVVDTNGNPVDLTEFTALPDTDEDESAAGESDAARRRRRERRPPRATPRRRTPLPPPRRSPRRRPPPRRSSRQQLDSREGPDAYASGPSRTRLAAPDLPRANRPEMPLRLR